MKFVCAFFLVSLKHCRLGKVHMILCALGILSRSCCHCPVSLALSSSAIARSFLGQSSMYSVHRCTEISLSNLEDSVTDLPVAKSFTIQKVLLTFDHKQPLCKWWVVGTYLRGSTNKSATCEQSNCCEAEWTPVLKFGIQGSSCSSICHLILYGHLLHWMAIFRFMVDIKSICICSMVRNGWKLSSISANAPSHMLTQGMCEVSWFVLGFFCLRFCH